MSDGVNGYGPPGAQYPYCLFVHTVNQTPVGTEITFVLDDNGWAHRLLVAYPPDDTEWRDKYLEVLEGGLRACSVVAPPGQPIVSLRAIDAQGDAIPEICCMYRIPQNDWLADDAPAASVSEEVEDEEYDEQQAMNKRLYMEGRSFNCCLCGTIVPEREGYHFEQLSNDQIRTLKLMSSVAKEFPFCCIRCYKKHLGVGKAMIGGATYLQGLVISALSMAARAYVFVWLMVYIGGFKKSVHEPLWGAAFVGSFLAIETAPAVLFRAARNPGVMMALFLGPVAFLAFTFMRPDIGMGILRDPLSLLGPDVYLINRKLFRPALTGAAAGFVLAFITGGLKREDTPSKKRKQDELIRDW